MTSIRHRIFVDECLPPTLVKHYLEPHCAVSRDGFDVVHHYNKYGNQGKWKDADFVPHLGADKRWLIISADSAKRSCVDPLPYICRSEKVTLILVTNKVREKSLEFYGPAILSHWQDIIGASTGLKGSVYQISMTSSKTPRTKFSIYKCPKGYDLVDKCCIKSKSKKKRTSNR